MKFWLLEVIKVIEQKQKEDRLDTLTFIGLLVFVYAILISIAFIIFR